MPEKILEEIELPLDNLNVRKVRNDNAGKINIVYDITRDDGLYAEVQEISEEFFNACKKEFGK